MAFVEIAPNCRAGLRNEIVIAKFGVSFPVTLFSERVEYVKLFFDDENARIGFRGCAQGEKGYRLVRVKSGGRPSIKTTKLRGIKNVEGAYEFEMNDSNNMVVIQLHGNEQLREGEKYETHVADEKDKEADRDIICDVHSAKRTIELNKGKTTRQIIIDVFEDNPEKVFTAEDVLTAMLDKGFYTASDNPLYGVIFPTLSKMKQEGILIKQGSNRYMKAQTKRMYKRKLGELILDILIRIEGKLSPGEIAIELLNENYEYSGENLGKTVTMQLGKLRNEGLVEGEKGVWWAVD